MSSCQTLLKALLSSSFFLIAILSFVSCSNNRPVESIELASVQTKPADTKENDKQFLVRAVEMKYEQVLLGKLAQRRSTSEEILALAKVIEETNRNEKSSLASLGIIKSIAVPAAPTQSAHAAYDKLNESSVEDFDFAYIRLVVQGYNDAISHFENGTRGNIDPDIQAKATAMLPEMRNHLSKAMELNGHMNPISELVRE